MKRRDLLKAMLASPVALGLQGWADDQTAHKTTKYPQAESTLQVRLHGPFAVILQKKARRITAYVPFDLDKRHEFQFYDPRLKPVSTEKNPEKFKSFHFRLRDEGLELSRRSPYIDHGFDDFTVDVGDWKPQPDQYFVSIELPFPDLITFVPPAEGVLFENGKAATAPIDHILEYRVRYSDRVSMDSKELGARKPLQCAALLKDFEEYWKQNRDNSGLPMSARKTLEKDLRGCAASQIGTYFFGVGLSRDDIPEAEFHRIAVEHAKNFFNTRLLGSLPQTPEVLSKQIGKIGDYEPFCTPPGEGNAHPASLTSIAQRLPPPRLQFVSAIEDCRGVGLIGLHG